MMGEAPNAYASVLCPKTSSPLTAAAPVLPPHGDAASAPTAAAEPPPHSSWGAASAPAARGPPPPSPSERDAGLPPGLTPRPLSPSRKITAIKAAMSPPSEWPAHTSLYSGIPRRAPAMVGPARRRTQRAARVMPLCASPPATSHSSAATSVRMEPSSDDPLMVSTSQCSWCTQKTTNAGWKVCSLHDDRSTSSGCAPASSRKAHRCASASHEPYADFVAPWRKACTLSP
mmetsp:Transcript_57776/g.162994  ORF Transcript_57776/g.162994 Transcript_57776/m.162994 type:complete len:230 (-) Transcript_57776:479-1168(-)